MLPVHSIPLIRLMVFGWQPTISHTDFAGILKVCKDLGLWGEGYVWIAADAATSATSLAAGVNFDQTPEETAALFSGMLNFFGSPEASAGYARFTDVWKTQGDGACVRGTSPGFLAFKGSCGTSSGL